ncbi:MAG: hypothetical protein JO269_03825 [Burkholderiaceae bacterium]|nr:hypothetical protein [Burkholderiaceae bacterium]
MGADCARKFSASLLMALYASLPATALADAARNDRLEFEVDQGRSINRFIRDGKVSAHVLLRSGLDPRVVVAFPAGNSGTGLWFAHLNKAAVWHVRTKPEAITLNDAKQRPLYGIVTEAVIDAPELTVKQAILSSVRVLRDPNAAVDVDAQVSGDALEWARDRLDGAAGYFLRVQVTSGSLKEGRFLAGRNGAIALKITAASGETPLKGLPEQALLNQDAVAIPRARKALSFLSYEEKFLAGSWRYNTYFGRDTLMSVCLLMPALQPAAVDAGLGSVLARLSPAGDVAHEEDIGEMAILDHRQRDGTLSDAPTFDYAMVDETFMLAPVAAAWLLDDARGRERAATFLARNDMRANGTTYPLGVDLVANLKNVVTQAAAFAAAPQAGNLIALKPDRKAGQWRDTDEGLGFGRYPYDVNAILVPAALEAANRFFASGLLDPYITADDRALFAQAEAAARVWRARAPAMFAVHIPNSTARERFRTYAAAVGVPPQPALKAIGKHALQFHALSLDAAALPVPVMHSDDTYALMFATPAPEELDAMVSAMRRPFPAGLMTGAGMVVANPAFASATLQNALGPKAYHGAVVWSWQQALFAAGIARQLQRTDLPRSVRQTLLHAQRDLWATIQKNQAMNNLELWGWRYRDEGYEAIPFGTGGSDADESNAAQLWSTVYLAVHPPALRH